MSLDPLEYIPDTLPYSAALDGVAVHTITYTAVRAAGALRQDGHAFVVIEPDDGTRYEVMIADRGTAFSARWVVATNFGPLHPWNGTPTIHPDYAAEKWGRDNTWTGVVMSLFLNHVALGLES